MKTRAIRWIGAFHRRGAQNLQAIADFELAPGREVAFGFAPPGQQVGSSLIGLQVDLSKSEISRIYAGDAYTISLPNGKLVPKRIGDKTRPVQDRCRQITESYHPYWEGTGRLVYNGVVVHRLANRSVRGRAITLAQLMGLPYLGTLK